VTDAVESEVLSVVESCVLGSSVVLEASCTVVVSGWLLLLAMVTVVAPGSAASVISETAGVVNVWKATSSDVWGEVRSVAVVSETGPQTPMCA
jgi:hypothetical protein